MIRRMHRPATFLVLLEAATGGACYSPTLSPAGALDETGGATAATSNATSTSSAQDSSTGASSDSSVASSTGAEASSDTTSGDACGNGILEDPETCDDGDRVDGNGCNNDCIPSGQTLWTVLYDGAEHLDDRPSRIAVLSDDSAVVAGYEGATPEGLALVHRYDSDGVAIWQKTYTSGANGDGATGVAVSLDDGIIFSTLSDGGSTGVLTWLSLDGDVEAEIPTSRGPVDVAVDAEGRIYVSGRAGLTPDPTRLWIAAYSQFGTQIWEFVESEGTQGGGIAIALAGDDGVAAIGRRDDSLVVDRRDADGDQLWLRTFGLDGEAIAGSVSVGVAITGSEGTPRAFVSVLDGDGVVSWMDVAELGDAEGFGITFDAAGNVVLAGTVYNNSFNSDALVMKYDPAGTLLWSQHWDYDDASPLDSTQALAVAVDSAGAILVTGITRLEGPTISDLWVRKLAQ